MKFPGLTQVRFVDSQPGSSRSWTHSPAAPLFPGGAEHPLGVGGVAPQPVTRVYGGPGTGKSSLLVDVAVSYLRQGVSADRIVIITQSKESAAALQRDFDEQYAQLAPTKGPLRAGQGGLVRSVHSLAFAVVRDGAVSRGEPEPALTTGARQDAVVRQLLAGHAVEGGAYWPAHLVPALGYVGMARAVRDFLLRAAERGVDGAQLEQLGASHNIAQWQAAGKFMREYQQVMRLAWQPSLNAAEIISAAIAQLDGDARALERFDKQIVLVDDAQHLSPEAAAFVDRFVQHAQVAIITGDEDQSVLHFRGASNDYLSRPTAPEVRSIVLDGSQRCARPIVDVVNAVSQRLPRDHSYRTLQSAAAAEPESLDHTTAEPGSAGSTKPPAPVRIVVHPSESAERATIADFLRRAHTERGVAWRDMAVILRSGAGDSPLFRALSRAGVPVQIDPTDMVLSQQRLVRALLLALRALSGELEVYQWEEFLSGPLVKMDPIIKDRLLRAIRRRDLAGPPALEQLLDLLETPVLLQHHSDLIAALESREREALQVPLELLARGRSAMASGVEETLWAVWQSSQLAEHLMETSLRGGAAGASADRDLDAVMALFDFAGDSVELNPNLTLAGFIASVEEQELPIGTRDRSGIERDAVRILSAHAALGRQWQVVVVAGVQDGTWPNLGVTGSVMKQDEFIALLDRDIPPAEYYSTISEQMAEERRLFRVAVSRAQQELLITAVDSPEDVGVPSVFVTELIAVFGASNPQELSEDSAIAAAASAAAEVSVEDIGAEQIRVLSVESLVAELRGAVANPQETETRRRQAARQLARLAQVEVPGAHPQSWWGLRRPTEVAQPKKPGVIRVSPSKVDRALSCPLSATLEASSPSASMHLGTMFHAAAEALRLGVSLKDAQAEITRVFSELSDDPSWRQDQELPTWLEGLELWRNWIATKEDIGAEVKVEVAVAEGVEVVGRIDRLLRAPDGSLQIVDIKTGKTPPTEKEIDEHAQLATYQVALAAGALVDGPDGVTITSGSGEAVSGAYLVFPRKVLTSGMKAQAQAGLTEEMRQRWRKKIISVAEHTGPGPIWAVPGEHCEYCSLAKACPADLGRR